MKKIDWKQVGWRFLQFLILLVLNSGLMFFIISKIVDVDTPKFGEVSLWNALTIKVFEYSGYAWYNDFLIYLSIIVGVILSIMFIKFLYKNRREKIRDEKKIKETDQLITKIFGKDQ